MSSHHTDNGCTDLTRLRPECWTGAAVVTGSLTRAAAPLPIPVLSMLVVLAVAAITLAGCGSSQAPATPGVVKVVAGENFWGNVAAQIGGRHVQVTSIPTSLTADPHLYESDVTDAVAVAEASLVIENGAGYDNFVSQLLSATSHPGRVVVCVQDVLDATGADVNPHFWYDIPACRKSPWRSRPLWPGWSPATPARSPPAWRPSTCRCDPSRRLSPVSASAIRARRSPTPSGCPVTCWKPRGSGC